MEDSDPVDNLRCIILGFFVVGYSVAGMNECAQAIFY